MKLIDLRSVGPATVKDLKSLSITTVRGLVGKDSEDLYQSLCTLTEHRHDPCMIDVFRAAIEQAENPNLAPEKKDWWYWSEVRKSSQN